MNNRCCDDSGEGFKITDQNRYNRIISVPLPSNCITPRVTNSNTNTNTNTNLELPIPINKGGTSAITANSALFNLGIDISNKQDGAILAYKTSSGNFEATNKPIKLSLDGGFF